MSNNNYLVLDTSVLIAHLRNFPGTAALLSRLSERVSFAISSVTPVEVWQGARPAETEKTRLLLQGLETFPLDSTLAETAGRLAFQLRTAGHACDLADAVIGATAMMLGAPILTTNRKHFEIIPNLEVWDLKSLL